MDYDATDIASTYDLGRDHGPEFLDLWMDVVTAQAKDQSIKAILDLGCGTGRFTEALQARFDANVIGLDPSEKMLEQARSKGHDRRVQYETGRAESIPLPDDSVDLVFMSMIFHHLEGSFAMAEQSSSAPVLMNAFLLILTLISSPPAGPFLKRSFPPVRSCARFLSRLDFSQ